MIYLNNAATGYPKPEEVIKTINKYIKSIPVNSLRKGFTEKSNDLPSLCRKKIGALFNIKNEKNIIFTSGSTESLNLAIKGLNLKGKHVITTVTEHNSVIRPLKHLERDGIIDLSFIGCDSRGYVAPGDIKKEIKNSTAALVINHCSNVTGAVQDLNSIKEILKEKIIFIVDASQSAGIIPVDVETCGIDMLAFTGHKSLHGLPGIGGLYVRKGIKIKPLKVGGTGVRSDLLYQPEEIPMYYEAGTQNLPGIISLIAGIDFIFQESIKNIKNHTDKITEKILGEFKKIPQITIYNDNINKRSSVFSFNIKGIEPEDGGYILENSFSIITRSGLHCAPLIHKSLGSYPKGSIRISPSYFTTFDEIDCFIDAIKKIVGSGI